MTKKKMDNINAANKYDGVGKLLVDISTKPLKEVKKSTKKKTTKKKVIKKKVIKKKVIKKVAKVTKTIEKTEKDIFNEILNSGEYFYLKFNNIIIYDSIKNKKALISFQDDYLILSNEIISYIGLKIKFKK